MGRLSLSNRLRLLQYYKTISNKRNRIQLCQDYLSNTLKFKISKKSISRRLKRMLETG
jgi:hypothetical protein